MINIFRFKSFSIIYITSRLLHTSKQQPTPMRQQLFDAIEVVENVDEARKLFRYMLQLKPRPPIWRYHKLLNKIVRMRHYPLVVVLFKKLILVGYPVDEYFMNTVINCYAKMNVLDLSFPVIGRFLKRGLYPNIVSFNTLIKGYFVQQNVEMAVALFKVLVRRKVGISEVTVNIVVDGLCKSGDVDTACRVLQMGEKNSWKLNAKAYTSIIDGFCKSGMLKDAMELLSRMIDRDVPPDIYTYTAFIDGLCRHGKLDFACTMLTDLPSKGVYPNLVTYTVVIQGLCKVQQFKVAKDILENMERFGFVGDSVTCNIVLKQCLLYSDNIDSINLLKHIVGRDFQLLASSFFVLLSKLRKIRHIYDNDVINHLILKLTSSEGIHQISNHYTIYSVVNSLTQK